MIIVFYNYTLICTLIFMLFFVPALFIALLNLLLSWFFSFCSFLVFCYAFIFTDLTGGMIARRVALKRLFTPISQGSLSTFGRLVCAVWLRVVHVEYDFWWGHIEFQVLTTPVDWGKHEKVQHIPPPRCLYHLAHTYNCYY